MIKTEEQIWYESLIEIYTKPLQNEIAEMRAEIKALKKAKNIVVQANVSGRETRCIVCKAKIKIDEITCYECSIPKM